MTRYRSVELLSEAGYVTESNFPLPVDDDANSFVWTGDGTGAGMLVIVGDYQYIATTRNRFQHDLELRKATMFTQLEDGQLDIGITQENSE